jgi:hypothetical protein
MARLVLAFVVGLFAAGAVVFGVESLSMALVVIPEGVDARDPEQVATLMAALPFGALASVAVGWGLGAFTGTFLASLVGRGHRGPVLAIAIVFLLLVISNFFAFPHPAWLIAGGLLLTVAGAWIGWRAGARVGRRVGLAAA